MPAGFIKVGERDAAEAHAEAIEKAAPRKSSGGEWAGANLVVHRMRQERGS
jgi:hypothetical protein